MIGQVWVIARNSFTESIRQPIFLIMILAGIIGHVLNLQLSGYTLDDDNKLLYDLGLSWILLCGLILAAFTASGVLAREIENKTVLSVISKPVTRPAFVIGKYLGVSAALFVAMWIWSIAFLLVVRHGVLSAAYMPVDYPVIVFGAGALVVGCTVAIWGNYFYRWVFPSAFTYALFVLCTLVYPMVLLIGKQWEIQPITADLQPQIIAAVVMVWMVGFVLTAIAVACSTRLGQLPTLLISGGLFYLGLASDALFGMHRENTIAAVAYAIVPNVQFFNLMDALTQGTEVTAGYIGMVSAYGGLQIVAILAIAVALFQRRDAG